MQVIRRSFRSLRSENDGENGFSLLELIVAMAILGIAMALIAGLFISFTNNFTKTRSLNDSTNVAAVGMNEMTKVIRAGTIIDVTSGVDKPIFLKAEKEEVILHSYMADTSASPKPILVRLSVTTARKLTEERWNATKVGEQWTFPALVATPAPSHISTTAATNRVIASRLIAPTAAQVTAGEKYLFTYLDVNGAEIATPVSATNLGNIASVKVTMLVQADITSRAKPVKLQSRVGLPNLSSSRIGLH